ncbi:AzlD domain-containing protein [Streptomyces decoyicus]|uniref:AzlD domain-containing protein n=1 Tax=Streptomyces decoyicus TaxID=249567 RepID=UPI0038646F6F
MGLGPEGGEVRGQQPAPPAPLRRPRVQPFSLIFFMVRWDSRRGTAGSPVVYCLRDLPLPHPRALAPLAALAVTTGLHLWRRNALLSVLGGTTVHVALAGRVFAP